MPLSPSSMASYSIPQIYNSNYTFFTGDVSELNPNNTSFMENYTMWGLQDNNFINSMLDNNNNGAFDHVVSVDSDTMCNSAWMPTFSDQQLGSIVSSDLGMPAISDCKMGLYGQNLSGRYMQPHIGEFGEECCGFVEDIKPPAAYPNAATENWGIQGNQLQAVEEPSIKVGRYSEEERKERILRYLKKRNQRNFNKTIKYACRKTLADRRVRVRGRFARNNELCEEDMATKKHDQSHHKEEDYYATDSFQFQLKNDEEDWLQEAMASLVYLSHSSPDDM